MTAADRCAALLSQLGADADPFRLVWLRADDAGRRMLLTIAKQPAYLSARSWDELSAASRGQIKARAADLHRWLSRAARALQPLRQRGRMMRPEPLKTGTAVNRQFAAIRRAEIPLRMARNPAMRDRRLAAMVRKWRYVAKPRAYGAFNILGRRIVVNKPRLPRSPRAGRVIFSNWGA